MWNIVIKLNKKFIFIFLPMFRIGNLGTYFIIIIYTYIYNKIIELKSELVIIIIRFYFKK
jgi:hypothetical protein